MDMRKWEREMRNRGNFFYTLDKMTCFFPYFGDEWAFIMHNSSVSTA
jgi:hypothetical protein